MKAFTFLFVLIACLAGCSTHFTSLQPEGEKQQILFAISEEQALKIAYSALSITIPGERIESIGGPVKGYSAIYRFAWDSYTQVVLLRPAQGVDESGLTVQGYYFEVSGSGSSYIKGKGKNVDLFNTVVEYAKATGRAIKVSQVKPVIQLDRTQNRLLLHR